MIKMAATPIYGKNLKKSSHPEPESPKILKLGMQQFYKGYVNDDPELTLTYLTTRSNLIACTFNEENCYKVI